MDGWIAEGFLRVRVDFGTLGFVPIRFNPTVDISMTDEQIESKILELRKELPPKVTWGLVREIAGVAPGTPHHTVKGVRLCQVRRVLKKLKNAKDNR